jgi:hypothetical protein
VRELNFKEDVKIDPEQLDVEWLMQARLYGDYAEELVHANDRLRRAEQKLKVIRSELVLEAAEKGERVLGKDVKPTAQNIEAYYRTDKEHIEAKEEYFQAALEAEMLQNAVYAMGQRKTALENLVKLHAANYFATPREPKDLSEAYRERLQEAREDMSKDTRERIRDHHKVKRTRTHKR